METDPLSAIRVDTSYEIQDAKNAAMMLCDPEGRIDSNANNFIWLKRTTEFIAASILYLIQIDKAKTKTIKDVKTFICNSDVDQTELLAQLAHCKDNEFVSATGQHMLDKPESERGPIISAAKSYLAGVSIVST